MVDKANILVIDDEMGPRESLNVILKPFYNVYTAESGKEAVEILSQNPIDLIMVDLKMPGLAGIEVLEKVKHHNPDIEAIIITGYASTDTAIEGLKLGASDYILKPFDVDDVLTSIRRALQRRNARLKLIEQKEAEKRRAEKAEEINSLKRQLVSALAHDIKSPLGLIMGYAEYLAACLEERPEAKEYLEYLSHIQNNAERIVKLVTGFLDTSKLEAGFSMERQPIDLNRIIREVGQQQMITLSKKNLELNVDFDDRLPEIMGDAAQLDRALWNLVSNAIKFTPQGGKITVISRKDDNYVCVQVKDTGMGIPQDELPLLFSEFRRLKGSGKVEGTGLGLFIVKMIVEAHGGNVDAVSKEGQGSTFAIRLPIDR